jgi:hypothetical protein
MPDIDRAKEFIRGLPKEAFVIWMTEYPAGQMALQLLSEELLRQDGERKRRSDAQTKKGARERQEAEPTGQG